MSTKIIEGVEYILKSSVEQIIKDRVSKVASRASTAELRVSELQSKITDMGKSISNVDILTSKVEELQEQLSSSTQKYQRYQTISKHGLSNPKMVDAIEWTYKYEQERLPTEKKQSLSDWLDQQIANPAEAHDLLRPHFLALQSPSAPSAPSVAAESPVEQTGAPLPPSQQQRPPVLPPSANRGAIPSPDETNFWKEAASNPDFYEANRAEIKARILNNRRQ